MLSTLVFHRFARFTRSLVGSGKQKAPPALRTKNHFGIKPEICTSKAGGNALGGGEGGGQLTGNRKRMRKCTGELTGKTRDVRGNASEKLQKAHGSNG